MKIPFRRNHLSYFLVIGLLWFVFGAALRILQPEHLYSYGYLILGAIYVAVYISMKKKDYLTIENGILTKHNIFSSQKIKLAEVTTVKEFAGDYIVKTSHEELVVNTQIIDQYALSLLDANLNKLAPVS